MASSAAVMMKEAETRKGPWTEQEDLQLVCYVGLFGERRWDFIAKVSGLNRNGKSCRLRWVNYLHPGLKHGRMSPQEQRLVLELHSKWGNRWSRIARKLPGRTDNEIKNYWRTHMRKTAQERKRNSSPPSLSSSSCNSPSSSELLPEVTGVAETSTTGQAEDGDGGSNSVVKVYSMDQIWNEIAAPEAVSKLGFEECRDETCDISCPPIPSPMWEYSCSDALWKLVDDDDFKMFPPEMGACMVENPNHS